MRREKNQRCCRFSTNKALMHVVIQATETNRRGQELALPGIEFRC
jgi:hypothetical protein